MNIDFARPQHLPHLKNQKSLLARTAFICEDHQQLYLFEYEIENQTSAHVITLEAEENETLAAFIDELIYWNPFVQQVILSSPLRGRLQPASLGFELVGGKWHYNNPHPVEIISVPLAEVLPEQLTVSEEKVKNAAEWITAPEEIIIGLCRLPEGYVCIDGYSRILVAMQKGYPSIYGYLDPEPDLDLFQTCRQWCIDAGIYTFDDLSKHIVSAEEHQRQWVDRCQFYLKQREIEGRENDNSE